MIPATPSLVQSKVSIAYISTHIRQTWLLITAVWHKDPTSTTLLVIRVLRLMMQVSSIAHMFLSKWFVPLVRTPSSQKSASRPVTVLLPTHSLKVQTRVSEDCVLTATATIVALQLRTSCDPFHKGYTGDPKGSLFYSK